MKNISENRQLEMLINVYEKEGLAEFAKVYDSFRKEAILDYGLYIKCEELLKNKAEELDKKGQSKKNLDEIKLGICSTFTHMRQSLEKDLKVLQKRQNLIDVIGARISKAYETLNGRVELEEGLVCFLHMHIIIDMCFACFQYEGYGYISRLHLPAMFYDLLRKWNKDQDEKAKKTDEDETNRQYLQRAKNFIEFYGDKAENDILNYTYQNVEIYCRKRSQETILWLKEEKKSASKRYMIDFVDKLIGINDIKENEQQKIKYGDVGTENIQEKSLKQTQDKNTGCFEQKVWETDNKQIIIDKKNNQESKENRKNLDEFAERFEEPRKSLNDIERFAKTRNEDMEVLKQRANTERKTEQLKDRKRMLNRIMIIVLAVVAAVCFMLIIILFSRINEKNHKNQTSFNYNIDVSRSFDNIYNQNTNAEVDIMYQNNSKEVESNGFQFAD